MPSRKPQLGIEQSTNQVPLGFLYHNSIKIMGSFAHTYNLNNGKVCKRDDEQVQELQYFISKDQFHKR